MKSCTVCGEVKSLGSFYKSKHYKDGRTYMCISCNKAKKKIWYANNKEAVKSKASHWNQVNVAKRLYTSTKHRAKTKGIDFTISVDDIVIPEVCPILGFPLEPSRDGSPKPNSPSIDRIDNSKGYVPGNVWIISRKANTMKSDATPEELKDFSRWVQRFYA